MAVKSNVRISSFISGRIKQFFKAPVVNRLFILFTFILFSKSSFSLSILSLNNNTFTNCIGTLYNLLLGTTNILPTTVLEPSVVTNLISCSVSKLYLHLIVMAFFIIVPFLLLGSEVISLGVISK